MAHALERALHDPGPWFIELDGFVAHAEREVREEALEVLFVAQFPRALPGSVPTLRCVSDELRAMAPVTGSDRPFEYRVTLGLPAEVAA
jgi:hypothetical protein